MKAAVAALATLLIGVVPALGEEQAAPPPSAQPAPAIKVGPRWVACTDEVQKFCADAEQGKGWVRNCLKDHTADLSEACKAVVAEKGDASQ